MANEEANQKIEYAKPELKVWGKIEDLTQTGSKTVARDLKGGSVAHPPGQGL